MKKIFLTSGLVLCMAAPAWATAINDSCTAGNLNESADGGNVQLRAMWTDVTTQMTLSSNIGTSTSEGGETGTSASPTLYLVPDATTAGQYNGVYVKSGTGDNAVYTQAAAGDQVITTNPQGIFVDFTFDPNAPSTGSVSGMPVAVAAGQSGSTAVRRPFLGFYEAGTTLNSRADTGANANQTITSTGYLTSLGVTDAVAYSNANPWIALYDTVHPTEADGVTPTTTGYTFQGWATSAQGTPIADFANYKIGETTPLFAIWDANGYTVTYNCNKTNASGASATPGYVGAYTAATATQTYTYDSANNGVTPLTASAVCSLQGWTATGWSCRVAETGGASVNLADHTGTGHTWTVAANVVCDPTWQQNTINLHWDVVNATTYAADGDTSCSYDSDFDLPANPTRTGFSFQGWEVTGYQNGGTNSPAVGN